MKQVQMVLHKATKHYFVYKCSMAKGNFRLLVRKSAFPETLLCIPATISVDILRQHEHILPELIDPENTVLERVFRGVRGSSSIYAGRDEEENRRLGNVYMHEELLEDDDYTDIVITWDDEKVTLPRFRWV